MTTIENSRNYLYDQHLFPLTVVVESRKTFSSSFSASESVKDVCRKALRSLGEAEDIAVWKVTDRHGSPLSPETKLVASGLHRQDSIYVSRRDGKYNRERRLVKLEDAAEQKI